LIAQVIDQDVDIEHQTLCTLWRLLYEMQGIMSSQGYLVWRS